MTNTRPAFACAVVLFWALGCVLPSVAAAGEIIVRRDAGSSAELVRVPDAREAQTLARLNADPDVRYAAANVPLQVAAAHPPPNDAYFAIQRDLEQSNDADIDLLSAWGHAGWAGPGAGVKVAVVDQSVSVTHRDLLGHIDNDLATDVVGSAGCDAPTPTGVDDHGTHLAGTIVATRNNTVGIAGIAPSAQVVPVRAFDNCGGSSLQHVTDAFRYAGQAQIPIVVGSFSTSPLNQSDPAGTEAAFADVFRDFPGTLFVVAAGNEGSINDDRPVYPCDTRGSEGVDIPNLICVGMSDWNDAPGCIGNVGRSVQLYAPGQRVFSTVAPNRIEPLDGTSMSAAVVAGVAALAQSAHPVESAAELKLTLLGAVDSPLGLDAGRINAAKAVGEAPVPGDLGGGPGDARGWTSCDGDHDGVVDAKDKCPGGIGTEAFEGCPDFDADGSHDGIDNCKTTANDQSDLDVDGIGDACDPDIDGDTLAEPTDRCPRVPAMTADGCPKVDPPPPGDPDPTPQPTPGPLPGPGTPTPPAITPLTFTAFSAKVSPGNCKAGPRCKKAAKLTIRLSRTAKVSVKVERKSGKKWKLFTSRTVTVTAAGKSLTFKGKGGRTLAKGSYRIIATISGGPRNTTTFRVV